MIFQKRIDNTWEITQRIRSWCLRNSGDIVVLDSCQIPSVENLGDWEILVGANLQVEQWSADSIDQKVDLHRLLNEGAGWRFFALSYDLKNQLENLSSNNPDSMSFPDLAVFTPGIVIGVKKTGEVYIQAPNTKELWNQIQSESFDQQTNPNTQIEGDEHCSMTESTYMSRVNTIREEIENGNVYEMNLCMEYIFNEATIHRPYQLFSELTQLSPTPFAAYIQWGSRFVISASPERFLYKTGDMLYSQPIKGTSKRHADTHKDQRAFQYLKESEKERAEHVMIVDLVRNDLSRCCIPGTVRVEDLFGVYSYAQVHQMISTVRGQLMKDVTIADIVQHTFPMGSMTGAPKVSAMTFIEELEEHQRGWYSGTIGYIDPDGNMDSNVVIRSILYDAGLQRLSYSVGGAITYDSVAQNEFEECQLKASAIRSILHR
ncbi:MAG: anthranilate synthase component I family protein [Flavobacteriales bacterium]|nr:anthranilate synthase component I family protein [Flavobacteriales bacterium]